MLPPLVIMGTGGLAIETLEWVLQYDYTDNIHFYADYDTRELIHGYFVHTSLKHLKGCNFITAVGNPQLKEKFYKNAIENQLIPCTPIITTHSVVGRTSALQPNTLVCPNATITSNVQMGHSATIHYGCTIGHDCNIGEYFTALPGCNISGNVTIGKYVTVGANACIREKLTIADNVFIGMGAVVVKHITETGVYIGNPARKLKDAL